MKVLFVESRLGSANWGLNFNVGIASMTGILNKYGHEADIFVVFTTQDILKLIQLIKNYEPDIIGFSFTESTFPGVKKISKKIKSKFPNLYIIGGGVYCIFAPQEIISCKSLDAICIGEGEYALLDLLKNFHNKNLLLKTKDFWFRHYKKIIKNPKSPPININLLPEPNRKIFNTKKLDIYQGSLFFLPNKKGGCFSMSRGCIFSCSYCASPTLASLSGGFSKYFRLLDPKQGIQQIQKAIKSYHYEYIIFLDDTFTLNKDWFNTFSKLYKKHIKLPYHCQLRIGTFTKETALQLKKSGCDSVSFGLESGDPELRTTILNKDISDEQIKNGVLLLKNAGLKVASYNMIGIPGETPEKLLKTIKLNAEINIDKLYYFIFHPYKGTKIYDMCLKKNILTKQTSSFIDREDTLLKMKEFNETDIRYFKDKFLILYNLRKIKSKNYIYIHISKLLFIYHALPPSSTYSKIIKFILNNHIVDSFTNHFLSLNKYNAT